MTINIKLLRQLTQAYSPSGYEDDISKIIFDHLKKLELEPKKDLHNTVKITMGKGQKKVLVTAHIDEIGIVVNHIDERGFLKVSPIGFQYDEGISGSRVIFKNGKLGVLIKERNNNDGLFLDIGAKNKKNAENLLPVGSFGVFVGELIELDNNRMISKAMDNRIGVYVLLKTIERLKTYDLQNEITFAFTAQGEFSGLGAVTTGYSIAPDLAISIDIAKATDTRSETDNTIFLDQGIVIKVMDHSLIAHPLLKNYFIDLCEDKKIPYQLEVISEGQSDAAYISLLNKGVPAIGLSIPARYTQKALEMVSKSDVENAIKILYEGLKGTLI